MNKICLSAIREHAQSEYPRESCGLLVQIGRKKRYFPCKNVAASTEQFILSPQDYAAAEDTGKVIGVVHSHPDYTDKPSSADQIQCEATGLPWYIISVTKDGAAETINRVEPSGYQAPLIGRDFSYGVLDCYTLVKDFYEREMGVVLPSFEHEDGWWNSGLNYYEERFPLAGFKEVEDGSLKVGDVILMQIRSPVMNHAGIFLGDVEELEGQKLYPLQNAFLHHLYDRLSRVDVYGGYWADNTRKVIRYEGC